LKYPNIKLLDCGIWNKVTSLKIKDMGFGHWGFMVDEISTKEIGSFNSITIGEI
jgi:hypothetical protein